MQCEKNPSLFLIQQKESKSEKQKNKTNQGNDDTTTGI